MSKRGAGSRILITRDAEDAAPWAEIARARGFEPVHLPCIRCEAVDDPELPAQLARALSSAAWLLFGSRRGVEAVRALAYGELPPGLSIGAVGPRTAEACRRAFGHVELIAPDGTARSLGEALLERLGGSENPSGPLVFAGADRSTGALEATLAAGGVPLRQIVVYRTVAEPPRTPRRPLAELGARIVLLASPSAVDGLLAQVEPGDDTLLISIGPATSARVRAAGLEVAGEARTRDIEGLLEAIP